MGLCIVLPAVLHASNKHSARKVPPVHFCDAEDAAIEYSRHGYRRKHFLCSPRHVPCFCLYWQFSLSRIHPVILTALLLDREQHSTVPGILFLQALRTSPLPSAD